MNKKLKDNLENMKPKKMDSAEKQVLWSKIEGGIDVIEKGYARSGSGVFSMGTRLAVASLAILVVLSSGSFATISAANASGPGDALFGLDLAVERFQLLISRADRRAELRLQFAEERLGEVHDAIELADLDGLDLQLALASTSTDDTATSTDDTATSTDDTATSTDDTSTSTDDTSTSTDDNNSTFTDDDDTDESDEEQEDRILRAQLALEVALERLEETRDELESEGNTVAVAALDEVIARLQVLAEDHVDQLDKLHAKLKEGEKGFKFGLKASSDDLKVKFSLKIGDGDNGGETDISFKEKDDKSSIKFRNDNLRFDFKETTDNDDNDENDDDDEDEDDDKKRGKRDRIDRDDRFNLIGKKVEICHKGKTIEVSAFAKYAHLWHGDELGACGDGSDNDDDDDDEDDDEDEDEEDEDDDEDEDDEDEDDEDNNDNSTSTDDVAPIISDVSATTTTSTAEISWTTDEDADSTVWYGTSTPIVVGSGDLETSAAFVTDHTLSITGLNASTTYYYVVESTDNATNAATSTEGTFLTL